MSVGYRAQALALQGWFGFCKLIGLDNASFLGGKIGEKIGPFFSAHNIAKRNIARALPHLSAQEQAAIVRSMWNNLGRVGAEIAFLSSDALISRVEIEGKEHLPETDKPSIFFSGHLGNWELTYPVAHAAGIPLTLIYRHANNPYVDNIIAKLRAHHATDMLPKGGRGAVRLGRALKNKHSLAMLVDQKMNEGVPVPFFGHMAMTAPAIAELSLKYNMPIIPARIVRLEGAYFKGIIYPPLQYTPSGNQEQDIQGILDQINILLESWIREHPEQWFWVHQRWPKDG